MAWHKTIGLPRCFLYEGGEMMIWQTNISSHFVSGDYEREEDKYQKSERRFGSAFITSANWAGYDPSKDEYLIM
jgi:hypothetical protein